MLPGILNPMKQGGYPEVSSGFTIVETMIVLAVTGVLFLSAVMLINGRQNRTQFTTAINLLQQQLQQIVNETASGFYPRDTAFSCTRGSSTPPHLNTQASGDHQGQNPDCIFLGKVIQFGVKNTDPELYGVFPILGNRLDTTGAIEASTLYGVTGSLPEAAAATSVLGPNNSLVGINTTAAMTQGLQAVSMWYGTDTTKTTGTVALVSTLPTPNGNGVTSGTQHLTLYTVSGSALQQTSAQIADEIYPGIVNAQPLVAVNSISICLASGTTNQSGLITIGPSDGSLASSVTVTLAIHTGLTCA